MKTVRCALTAAILLCAIAVTACEANPTPIVIVVTAVPQPTQPPPPPTYTPAPTYTPLPTYTPYPTPTTAQPPTTTPAAPASPTGPAVATPTATLAAATPTATVPPPTVTRTATPTRTPVACAVPYATQLHVGGQAKVQNDTSHYVRTQPNTTGRILGTITTGQIVNVLDGPVCGNNMWWWYIRTTDGSLVGWTAEASASVRWLINYTGGSACVSTTERITFPAGGTCRKVITTLTPPCTKTFVLRIMAGQRLAISLGGYPNPGLDSLIVTNPVGAVVPADAAAGTRWYNCATTGDYKITISGTGVVQFDITVPPL